MVPHLECAAAAVWETAILISIRLCLSSLSTHKSLLQSEINSYWSALISQVRHEGNATTGTSHRSQRWKHHFVCEIPTLHAAPLHRWHWQGEMMVCVAGDLQSAGHQPHTSAHMLAHAHTQTYILVCVLCEDQKFFDQLWDPGLHTHTHTQ